MTTSESIKSLTAALGRFHAAKVAVSKDATNPHFKTKYASLSSVLDAISAPMQEAGLVFTQFPDGDTLTTRIIETKSGEWMEGSLPLKGAGTAQQQGSALTYARRYALCSILGLSVEDDDGNAASQPFAPSRADLTRLTAAIRHERLATTGKWADVQSTALNIPLRKAFDEYLAKVEKANAEYQYAAAEALSA